MRNLPALFEDMRDNKARYLASTKGADFEDRINTKLHAIGYSRLTQNDGGVSDALRAIKPDVLDGSRTSVLRNPFDNFRAHFIHQPYSSQNYPDFVIFDGDVVVCVETKFSSSGVVRPVWNSGLPRQTGIYVFGAGGENRDLTFFRGCDVITVEESAHLHKFFKRLKKDEDNCNHALSNQRYGFVGYVRKAFAQTAKYNKNAVTGFFANPEREKLENSVISHLRG